MSRIYAVIKTPSASVSYESIYEVLFSKGENKVFYSDDLPESVIEFTRSHKARISKCTRSTGIYADYDIIYE